MSSREKELHAIAYGLEAHRKDFQCQGCGWKVRIMRCPPKCPVCGGEVKEEVNESNL